MSPHASSCLHPLWVLCPQVLNEVDYMKVREMEFHESTEAMERNAQYWPMLQICILCLTGFFQVNHLKKFFQRKKLV